MAEVSKITQKASEAVKESEEKARSGLAIERKKPKKNTAIGGEKPSETFKKFGEFGYFFLFVEAFIIVGIFLVKDLIDIIGTATIAAAGVGEVIGEIISIVATFIVSPLVAFWLWFRFGKSKNASQQAKKYFIKVIGWFAAASLADLIPILDKVPWLTIYGLFLYGVEFLRMSDNPAPQEEIEEFPPVKNSPQEPSNLRRQLEQKTS